jgi:hypothetical protein
MGGAIHVCTIPLTVPVIILRLGDILEPTLCSTKSTWPMARHKMTTLVWYGNDGFFWADWLVVVCCCIACARNLKVYLESWYTVTVTDGYGGNSDQKSTYVRQLTEWNTTNVCIQQPTTNHQLPTTSNQLTIYKTQQHPICRPLIPLDCYFVVS